MDMQRRTTDNIEATVEQIQHLWPHLSDAQRAFVMAMDSPGGSMCSLAEIGERMGRTKNSVIGILNALGRKIKRVFPDAFDVQGLNRPGTTAYTIVLFQEELNEHPEIDGMWLFRRRPALHAFLVAQSLLSENQDQ
jgi:hypothetical protein